MAYELRLLWHTTPPFMPYEPFLLGGLQFVDISFAGTNWVGILGEAKPGGFKTGGFPTSFGKGPDCVADPFGTVPRRCS